MMDRRVKQTAFEDAMYRITKGPASFFHNVVMIKDVVIQRFDTIEEARDHADLINRALIG